MQQLIQMRAKELLSDEEFRQQKAFPLDKKFALEAIISQKCMDVRHVREHLQAITAPLTDLVQTWDRLDIAPRERFKRMLLPVGFLAGQTRTAEKALLFSLIQDLGDPNSTLVAVSVT